MTTTVRRVVTGHDETGKAIVLMDGAAGNVNVRPGPVHHIASRLGDARRQRVLMPAGLPGGRLRQARWCGAVGEVQITGQRSLSIGPPGAMCGSQAIGWMLGRGR